MGLETNLEREPIESLNLRTAVAVDEETPLHDVVAALRTAKLGCAMVTETGALGAKPIGMFTEAMLRHLLADDPSVVNDPVGEHMATQYAFVANDDPVSMLVDSMVEKNVRFACVVDGEGNAVALTGQKGLVEYVAEHFPMQVNVQRIGGPEFPTTREGA